MKEPMRRYIKSFLFGLPMTYSLMLSAYADENAILCQHFAHQYAQMQQQHPHESLDTIGTKALCFKNCTDKQIEAEQFWRTGDPVETKKIRNELMDYVDWRGFVSNISLPGNPTPVVRIARRVGTASCIRDTYLRRTTEGYELIHNEQLEKFSQEAGYCGADFIYFSKYKNATYAVEANYGDAFRSLTAYKADPLLNLKFICTGPQEKNVMKLTNNGKKQ